MIFYTWKSQSQKKPDLLQLIDGIYVFKNQFQMMDCHFYRFV